MVLRAQESGSRAATHATAAERLLSVLLPFLVRWTHRRLPARARRRMDSGDLVQEALVGVLEHLPDLEARAPAVLCAYAQQAIRNRIRDEIRRAGRVEVAEDAGEQKADRAPSPLDLAIRAEEAGRYRSALARLPREDRELIVGRVERGASYDELARELGRSSAEAARAATRRAVLHLARLMGEE